MTFTHLFSEGRIGPLKPKNRLFMAPMVRNYADEEGRVTPRYMAHIERIAAGGVGTLILEASHVSPEGRGFSHGLGAHDDAVIPGLRELGVIAHHHGALIGQQLFHAGRQTSSGVTGTAPVAPSPIPDPIHQEVPHALDPEEIQALVTAFGQGARRARDAGLDFVELHAAHGYLINEFLSPYTNKRDDMYGGSPENRLRFLLEIIAAVKVHAGDDFPITVRVSGDELVPEGLHAEEVAQVAARLEEAGVQAVHVSAGNYASYNRGLMIQPMAIEDGPLVGLAGTIRKAVSIPVIAVGKLRFPDLGERALVNGDADFIAIGRPLLADPDWPRKAEAGQLEEINHCIACNQGCIGRLFADQDVWCTVRPETGREAAFARPANGRRNVLIVGGGPGGMEAAAVAANRGHHVVLYERGDRLGGQLIPAAAAPHRNGWEELRQRLVHELDKTGVELHLNESFDPQALDGQSFDAAILAAGAHPIRPDFPGQGNIIQSTDLLAGQAEATGEVVVVGGGCSGAQTAEYLAEKGHRVTIVEMTGAIATDAPMADRSLLLSRLDRKGVDMRTETKVMHFAPGSVTVEHEDQSEDLKADTVVLCLGNQPNDGIEAEMRQRIAHTEVIGDEAAPRKVTEAMAEGAMAALRL